MRSSLVVLERGWLDMIVDPLRYRTSRATGLIRRLGRLLPEPDLVLLLDAEPKVVRHRKSELDDVEIDRQLRRWRALARDHGSRFEALDATRSADEVLDDAVAHINSRLASRQFDAASCDLAWCLGKPAQRGRDYWVVARGGRPRWFLHESPGARSLLRTGVFRPARARHLTAALALEAARRASRGRIGSTVRITVDPETGIAPAIASRLGKRVEIAALALPKERNHRALLSIADDGGKLIAFAKVALAAEPVRHERRVLEQLTRIGPESFVAPRVLDFFEWSDCAVLVLEPVAVRGRSDRRLNELEVEVLVELSQLGASLSPVLGHAHSEIPVHGDFAPWNSSRNGDRGLVLWDWEGAHLGYPLEDYFHWHTQRLVLLSAETPADLVKRALRPDPMLRAVCERMSIPLDEAPRMLRAYLERSAALLQPGSRAMEARLCALELLLEDAGV
jgi:hypothetical protein